MKILQPTTPEELAAVLKDAAEAGEAIRLAGASSKAAMGGPLVQASISIDTTALKRLRQYEPRDLTISVEAGMPWCELEHILAENRQMVPLDPPFLAQATVGGVIAANCSGPRRRLYGTARDVIIGMTFATLEGKLVQSGGMVVKNVAGLDMAKMMVGSFGTLAAIAVVNFKLAPIPSHSRTFVREFPDAASVFASRDGLLKGVLQPAAIDVLNPAASARCGRSGWLLALRAGGNEALLNRYARELPQFEPLDGGAESTFWTTVQEFTPRYLAQHPGAVMLRVASPLSDMQSLVESLQAAIVARAGTGVAYAHFQDPAAAVDWMTSHETSSVLQFAPESVKQQYTLWPRTGSDFETMTKIKRMFDPRNLLNPGRLYGRI